MQEASPMLFSVLVLIFHAIEPHFSFPQSPIATEQIMLRWLHFVFGIIWIGLLYFFNLVGFPTMKQLEATVRGKIYPVLMSRAMGRTLGTAASRFAGSVSGSRPGSLPTR
jgi:hypothetical protein